MKIGRIGRIWFSLTFFGTLFGDGVVTYFCIQAYMNNWLSSPYPELLATISLFGGTAIIIILCVARLHDMGRSGWWTMLPLPPLLSWLVLLVMFFIPGKNVTNPDDDQLSVE